MFIKIEFEMRDWKDLSWDEIQKKVIDYAAENFPESLMLDHQGVHYFDQRTSVTEFFKSSEFYVNRDIDDLTNVLEIRNKKGEDVLYGRLFADVGRKGVLSRFSAKLDDQRIA